MRVQGEQGATLVFNDLIFNLPHGAGLAGLIFRLMGSTGGPRVTRIGRLFVVRDRGALRAYLEKLAADPKIERIIMAGARTMGAPCDMMLRSIAQEL